MQNINIYFAGLIPGDTCKTSRLLILGVIALSVKKGNILKK